MPACGNAWYGAGPPEGCECIECMGCCCCIGGGWYDCIDCCSGGIPVCSCGVAPEASAAGAAGGITIGGRSGLGGGGRAGGSGGTGSNLLKRSCAERAACLAQRIGSELLILSSAPRNLAPSALAVAGKLDGRVVGVLCGWPPGSRRGRGGGWLWSRRNCSGSLCCMAPAGRMAGPAAPRGIYLCSPNDPGVGVEWGSR